MVSRARKLLKMVEEEMVKPPKKWWDSMVKEIKDKNPDYSDEQVEKAVNDVWSGLDDAKREEILKSE